MVQDVTMRRVTGASHRLRGIRGVAYWSGRALQILGLLLMWWVLLLFTSTRDLPMVVYGGTAAAVVVFYLGWACTVWGRKHC
jgi:hypothetical protein